MEKLKPKLFSVMKTYTKEQFIKDIISGIIVAIIALPLSIALALASGVTPEKGLYTAIIAGFVISFLGGSRVQIAGPTAAFATIVGGIVAKNGFDGLVIATILAGIILIIMGLCKFGNLIKFIPYTITTGFTAGIAVTLIIGQIKDFLGLTFTTSPIETLDKVKAIIATLTSIHYEALIIGLISLVILIFWPKISKRIPGSLIAIIIAIIVMKFTHMQVNTIGSLFTISNKLPSFHVPAFTFVTIKTLIPDAVTIAVLAGIESLLSCVVSDGMVGSKHRSNMELVAQGVGNICSGLFGGIPATGAIARTAANVKNGGRTPIAGMVHSLTLLLVLVVLMPYAALIPMPTIAAILFMVAYHMSEWRQFVDLIQTASKSDILVLLVTFILTVTFDLVIAIEVGVILAAFLFIRRMSNETNINGWKYIDEEEDDDPEGTHLKSVPPHTFVYEIIGPMFFGAADKIMEISTEEEINSIILRMRGVPALDSTAVNNLKKLYKKCANHHITLILSHVNEQPMHTFQKAGFDLLIGEGNFCSCIDDALMRAKELAK